MRGLALGFALGLGACSGVSGPSGDGLLSIDDVVIHVAESYPAQATAQVAGWLPDTCTSLGEISQTRSGDSITIVITTRKTGQVCAQVIEAVEKWIPLVGTFPPGQYVVRVNTVVRRFGVD